MTSMQWRLRTPWSLDRVRGTSSVLLATYCDCGSRPERFQNRSPEQTDLPLCMAGPKPKYSYVSGLLDL